MDEFQLLIDLHKDGPRQGPGGDAETELALKLAGFDQQQRLRVADIGCGTGAASFALARILKTPVTAVDLFPDFLSELELRSAKLDLSDLTQPLEASMDDLPFEDESFDLLWSEGAIYTMGFEAGLQAWRRFLKPGGVLAVSELCWFTHERPSALQSHWENEYAEVDTASAKIAQLEKAGYTPIGYFPLPEKCWIDNYYRPLQARFETFLDRNGRSDKALEIVAREQAEIKLYERFSSHFGYGFFIARKL